MAIAPPVSISQTSQCEPRNHATSHRPSPKSSFNYHNTVLKIHSDPQTAAPPAPNRSTAHSMGICASCLGLRGRSDRESSETSRLLFDDPYQSHYGGVDPNGGLGPDYQPDPEVLKREREALEAICLKTSENVIDIFASPQTGDTGDRAAKARQYRRIMEGVLRSHPLSSDRTPSGKDVGGRNEDGDAVWRSVKRDGIGKLYSPFGGPSQEIRSIIGSKG